MAIKQILSSLVVGHGRTARERDNLWPDERPISLMHPLVPEQIRLAIVGSDASTANLHRVQTAAGIEWWLLDDDGNLLDSFWLADDQAR